MPQLGAIELMAIVAKGSQATSFCDMVTCVVGTCLGTGFYLASGLYCLEAWRPTWTLQVSCTLVSKVYSPCRTKKVALRSNLLE